MKLPIPNLGQGVNKDQMPEELPLGMWSGCLDMRARDGYMERFQGFQATFTQPSIIPYYCALYSLAGVRYGFHAGLAKIFADDGTTQTEIATGLAGAIDDRWTGDLFNGTPVFNNGVDIPKYWSGAGSVSSLPGWPAGYTVDAMRAAGDFLVGFGVYRGSGTKERHTLMWSDVAQPGAVPTTWTASDTNLAGDQALPSNGDMVDGVYWNGSMLVFKEDSVFLMRRSGGNEVFTFTPTAGSGMLFRGCGVATPKGVVVLTTNDVVLHNGIQEQSIAAGRMQKWIFSTMSTTTRKRCFVAKNEPYKEVWVCFPSIGKSACTYAAVWNWELNTWAIRTLPDVTYAASGLVPAASVLQYWNNQTLSWQAQDGTWVGDTYSANQERMILCTSSQKIGLVDQGGDDFGMTISPLLERTGMHLDDPNTYKLLTEILPVINSSTGTQITFQFGSHLLADGLVTWRPPRTFTQDTTRRINDFTNGPFLALRLRSAQDRYWRIKSMVLDYELGGTD